MALDVLTWNAMRCTILLMPRDFTHGRFPPRKINKNTVGGKMPLAAKIVGTVFLLFWMAMPTRALIEMLSKEKLACLREAPFPGVIMILVTAIFPIAGLAGLISIWRRRAPTGQSAEESPLSAEMQPQACATFQSFDTPLTGLKLKRTGGESGAKILFTCMWCVFSFVFTTIWFTASGGFSWTKDFWTFDKFFVLIFPLVGIGFIIFCVRDAIRRALTGRYEIEIACDRLRPGARVQVTYKFNGDTSRLKHVVFSLTQQSMAMQRSTGTMRMSGGSPMESKDVVCTIDDPMRAQYGTFTMTIPAAIDSPRIAWRLVVKYAGITDTFRLDVG